MNEKEILCLMIEKYRAFLSDCISLRLYSAEWIIQSQLDYDFYVENIMKNHSIK